jgi:phosphohistidine phosphatase SixA
MRKISSSWRLLGLVFVVLAIGSHHDHDTPEPDGASGGGPRIVMIIRHAEKPEGEKDPNLSQQGFERAKALATVIPEHFPRPDFLIATKRSKESARPLETITPLSAALHEAIESKYKDEQYSDVARLVLTDPKFAGKVVLIAWHHGKIPDLAKALGVKDALAKWNSQVFDRVWKITYENGVPNFQNLPQKALPGDSEE